jgi:hypothetical protein
MELLDRYLQAVRFWLPRAQQDDIIAELGDDLRSQIEDRESALSRPLTEDEMVALLQQSGHPMRVAARYQPQQSLIGPTLFPIYKFVLKVITCVYLGPWFLVWIGVAIFIPANHADTPLLSALSGWAAMWTNIFFIFGLVTLIFAVLERVQASVPELYKWDPRKLPAAAKRKDKDRVPRVESIFGLIFSVLFALWWLGLPRYGHWLMGPVDAMFSLNPALRAYHLPFLVPTLVLIVQQCVNLFRPQWKWLRAVAMLVADIISLVVVHSALNHYPYVILNQGAKTAASLADAQYIVNQVMWWSLACFVVAIWIAVIVHGFQSIKELYRLAKARRMATTIQISQSL